MTDDERAELEEKAYLRGRNRAWWTILTTAAAALHLDMPDGSKRLIVLEKERSDAVAVLRHICEEWGDNDWPDNLHLADVLEKHLERFLKARNISRREGRLT